MLYRFSNTDNTSLLSLTKGGTTSYAEFRGQVGIKINPNCILFHYSGYLCGIKKLFDQKIFKGHKKKAINRIQSVRVEILYHSIV